MEEIPKPPPEFNPYAYRDEDVEAPPSSLGMILRRIGPGMILAASIVGSGELIATTTLGSEVGYTALWVILLSCFLKPAIQAELGRYTIASGETGLEAVNHMPGPRFKVNWVVWAWSLMTLMSLLQIGAMYGGVAQVFALMLPEVSVNVWVAILMVLTLALLLRGTYGRVEGVATVLVGIFTLMTLCCALILMRNPQSFSWDEVAKGLEFQLPSGGLATAVAVFGITGVGATELFMYPYWCVEKGYARFTGKRENSAAWVSRAKGWTQVMSVDIFASMLIYTVATVAFYLLGAGVLNKAGLVPAASDMIKTLSRTYTDTLGPAGLGLFYAGAIAVLYSTIFASTAANARVYADMAGLMGLFDRNNYTQRLRYQRALIVLITLVPIGFYYTWQSPVAMVRAGGVAQAAMLPIIAVSVLYLRYCRLPKEVIPSKPITVALWTASSLIIILMSYYAWMVARG